VNNAENDKYDYIVVGSGAGGGPLAGRLAQRGYKVLLIEAGSDDAAKGGPRHEVSLVPSLHAVSTEHPDLSWQFFVNHYDKAEIAQFGPDPKRVQDPTHEGFGKIFYPRAAALGGCTIHNAMITIAGPNSDWDDLADFLKDKSWRGATMRQYFERLEHNDYSPPATPPPSSWLRRAWENLKWLAGYDPDHTGGRHGFAGWLHTSVTDIRLGLHDGQLISVLKAALLQSKNAGLERASTLVRKFLKGQITEALDPNHSRTQAESPEGLAMIPLAVCGKRTTIHQNRETPFVMRGRRSSPREFLLQVKASHPHNLTIWTECFVTKVLFDGGDPPRAVGVELHEGERLYNAHPGQRNKPRGTKKAELRPHGEVILCGGTFNTPQLLMLSGIGDLAQLVGAKAPDREPERGRARSRNEPVCALHGRDGKPLLDEDDQLRRVHSPGVGQNLQDRYEVTVISKMKQDFSLLDGATFALPEDPARPDPQLQQWRKDGTGLYTSNGAVLGIFKRSLPDLAQPDLFIFGIPSTFKGYKLGYSKVGDKHDYFTWTILKAHTTNRDGEVRLSEKEPLNPLAPPDINFHYFNTRTKPGESAADSDLAALVDGVKFVRGIAEHASLWIRDEDHPGFREVPKDPADDPGDRKLKDWIRRVTWGHHACGTCRMGPDGDDKAVLDSHFRVRGVRGLRVVDASIFPKIPGYFIVTNIYMASEKAADTILEDARLEAAERAAATTPAAAPDEYAYPDAPAYPRQLRAREVEALRWRRDQVPADAAHFDIDLGDPVDPSRQPMGVWSENVTGLGLSGGGIRSATLNLGILQALARHRWLRRIDFLSTASGGGYIGSFLGRFFDRLRPEFPRRKRGQPPPAETAPDRVEGELNRIESPVVGWLRKHGNYIAPSGPGDGRVNVASFLRNFLSIHLVVGVLIFAFFGIANAIRYGLFDPFAAGLQLAFVDKGDFPIGHLLKALLGPFFSPWFIFFELIVLFLVIPRIVGYWIVSQDRHLRFQVPALTLLFLVTAALLYAGVRNNFALEPMLLAFSLLASFIHVELAWRRVKIRAAAVGSGGMPALRLRTRSYLTQDLGLAIATAGAALVFALIDTVGHGLQQWTADNMTYAKAFAVIGGMVTVLVPILRWVADLFARVMKYTGPPSTLARIFQEQMMAGLLAVVLFTAPLILYALAAHVVYKGGDAIWVGISVTLFTLVLSLILAHPGARAFVNRSSLAQLYAARLSRAYLGASNPLRHRPEGANITEVMAGDDVSQIQDYRPFEAGGPLHVINLTVNQTVDFTSQRGNRDRKGENVAVSCIGMSIGERWHSAWDDSSRNGGDAPKLRVPMNPLGYVPGTDHPLVDETGMATSRAESLPLREWMAISGAAMGPGRGQTTQLGTALLMGLANLRTDYWWDSGITEAARNGFPKLTLFRRVLYLFPRVFTTQALLLYGWIARFPGPWERFWNLADGGFLDNTAGYELIRRRVPRIIICDGTADPRYQFDDFSNLVRKVRIDFEASIEPFSKEDLESKYLPEEVRQLIGNLEELKPPIDPKCCNILGPSKKHAALFWVKYRENPKRKSVLLYLKANVTGDENADVEQYHTAHPEFPHESTGDQFFEEDQWESYRLLGDHMASPLFDSGPWLWSIPLSDSNHENQSDIGSSARS
jgi:choline dehydrogenase-like flavoprotein